MRVLRYAAFFFLVAGMPAVVPGQTICFDDAKPQRWEIGMKVEATGATTGINATMPVPVTWPEQQVKLVGQDVSSNAKIKYEKLGGGGKKLGGGVTQMRVTIRRLNAGQTAHAFITLEIVRGSIHAPAQTAGLKAPAQPPQQLRQFLGNSPQIETTHRDIQRLAVQIAEGKATDWEKAEAIYDWIRANIQYRFDKTLRGAVAALKAGRGDCEEMTSLFIALCRANRIPARSVWIPDHCYPEFYLEDAQGKGHWFPCQVAGAREYGPFGEMYETRPILQKGDDFRVGRVRKRYVAETFSAANALRDPRYQYVRRQVPLAE